jgi:D-alanyl-D-alanine carboxypeptidase
MLRQRARAPEPQAALSNKPAARPDTITPSSQDEFNKQLHSLTEPSSIWVIANKTHALPTSYAPASLVTPEINLRLRGTEEQMKISSVASSSLESLFAAAKKDGLSLKLSSGYRSGALQKQFYDSYVARDGQTAADTYSARPGTSEHQTGLAADIIPDNDACHLEVCFANLPEGAWLAKHAHEHGFIIRYLKDKQAHTGYQYEPWHIRYVDKGLAKKLYESGLTMEEFFDYQ